MESIKETYLLIQEPVMMSMQHFHKKSPGQGAMKNYTQNKAVGLYFSLHHITLEENNTGGGKYHVRQSTNKYQARNFQIEALKGGVGHNRKGSLLSV
jgi:hypothetical protein